MTDAAVRQKKRPLVGDLFQELETLLVEELAACDAGG